MNSRSIGQLFTEVYREKGEPSNDSQRFRIQIGALFDEIFRGHSYAFYSYLKRSAGIDVPRMDEYILFDKFFLKCSIDELLDCITHIVHFLSTRSRHRDIEQWIKNIQFAFDAQNLSYEIDERGGVHHKIDAAFAHSKVLTLACLASDHFSAARDEIQKAFEFLTQTQPDTKLAVLNAFLAAESVFKITIAANNDLTSGEARKCLLPLVQKLYANNDDATKQASARLVNSFSSWADSCHPYRHGQKDASVIAPPSEIAIALVTAGADFIRWLVALSER